MTKKIYFDMDGTIADLYNAENWLEMLLAETKGLFRNLKTMHDKTQTTKAIERLIGLGYEVEIITWTPKNVSNDYIKIVEQEKKEWIAENFPMIEKIHCLGYGVPKQNAVKTREKIQILVDDNLEVNEMWETPKRRKSIMADENLISKLQLIY